MTAKTVLLLHPRDMGVTIGAAAATSGACVIWVSEQRSRATQDRARQASFCDIGNLTNAVRECDIILSVCPLHAAKVLAKSIAQLNFGGIYLDANAMSRTTSEEIGEIVTKAGASFIDGGIIGPPVK